MQTIRLSSFTIATLAAVAVAACLGTGSESVLEINSTGTVEGIVYFDRNGNRDLDAGASDGSDAPVADVGVRLLARGTTDTLGRATSDADGLFRMSLVPVGNYDVVVDQPSVPDSFSAVLIDTSPVTVTPDDSVEVLIALSFDAVSIEEARSLPADTKVFVEGIALNGLETFGDLSVHLADAAAAIRVTRVSSGAIVAGDRARLLGTVRIQQGQPTLDDASAFFLETLELPTPERVSTLAAANANGGTLDANQVEVVSATIGATSTVAGDLVLEVDDGSGTLEVLLDADVPFTDVASLVPGVVLDATGVLVPKPGTPGVWQLKPRSDADLQVK